MPAATTLEELRSITKREFAKLTRTLDTVDEGLAGQPIEDNASIKDIIGHRAHWITLFFTWVEDGRAGKPVETPAPGYNWGQLKAYNASVREAQRDLSWVDMRERLVQQHERLMAFIDAETQESLYTPHLYPWMRDWTLGRWAEASGASHYRSATTFVRKAIRDRKAA